MMKPSLASAAALATVLLGANPVKAAVTVLGAGPERTCYLDAAAGSTGLDSLRICNEALNNSLSLHDRAATFVNLGIILHARGENEEAMMDFKQCLSIMPDQADAYLNLGVAYVTLKQYDTALTNIEKGISLHPSDMSVAYYDRGVAEEQLGRLSDAYRDYQSAATIAPKFTEAVQAVNRFKSIIGPHAP
jgi:tetratricopeptide (TPR) repeat protein